MNRKGQVLVSFLLILPLLLIILVFVVDMGLMKVSVRKVEHVIKEAITYELKSSSISDSRVNDYIKNNLSDIKDVNIVVGTDNIKVSVSVYKKSIFNSLIKNKNYTISKSYYGYKENDKINIIKENGYGN